MVTCTASQTALSLTRLDVVLTVEQTSEVLGACTDCSLQP